MKKIRTPFLAVALIILPLTTSALNIDDSFDTENFLNTLQPTLSWKKLSFTDGLSYNEIETEFGIGLSFEGYCWATHSEVEQLFFDAGIPADRTNSPGTLAAFTSATGITTAPST